MLKYGEARKGTKREDGCNEHLQILIEEFKAWGRQNQGRMMPGYIVLCSKYVFESEEEQGKEGYQDA